VIKSFASRETADLFAGRSARRIAGDVQRRALQKLAALHAVTTLDELRRIPGNRLEKLKGNRTGQYSVRINNQWRICFVWLEGNAHQVEIVDYHH
jgi:proteic killer suppression protein